MRSVPSPVAESPWILRANGDRIASGTATPGMDRELATGLLAAAGFVAAASDLETIDIRPLPFATLFDARVAGARHAAAMAERAHQAVAECDMLHFVVCEPGSLHRARTDAVPGRDQLSEMLAGLFERCQREHVGGGVHAAALVGGGAEFAAVDVGRHNAVDKAIGAAILAEADVPACGLVLTARVSGRIALSAARAGVAWIASRSIPTTLAIALASAAGLTIVARAASAGFHIFSAGPPPGAT